MREIALWFGIGMMAGVGLVWAIDAVLCAYYAASDEVE